MAVDKLTLYVEIRLEMPTYGIIWNSTPLHIRQSQTYSSFRHHLKTYYFLLAHPAP